MSHVRDMSLAESGRMKIRWVQDFMPALVAIRARFEREKPFAGKKITISIHMEAKTAFLALCLAAGGAEVHATGCNPLSTQDDVAAGLASMGVETYAMHGVNAAEYRGLLVEALSCCPDLIIDDGGDLLDLPPHEAMVAEQTDHSIDGGSLSFDISSADRSNRFNAYASFQNTARKSYYGSKQDLDAYGTTHDLTLAAGMQYVHAFRKLLFMPSELTLGTEYSYDDLSDRSIGYDIRTDQTVHIVGAYLQNEWKTRKWSLLIGGRLDKHSLVDHAIFSPRANVRFNPSESVNLRVSYAGGYRAPQAFDEDMHIAIVGGKRVRIRLADDLKEERSHSVSLSADLYHTFGRVQTNLLVEGFYTRLDDVFALRDIEDTADGGKIKERYNGSGATVRGLNAEGRAVFTRWFELQAGVTWQRSRYVEPEYWSEDKTVPPVRRMFRTPDLYGYFTASLKPLRNFTADVTGTCTGEMLVQHMAGSGVERDVAVTTPAFCDVNLRLAYDLRVYKEITLQLYGGVQNLFNAYQKDFDKGVDRDSGYIYGPSLPRSWFIGAKVSF